MFYLFRNLPPRLWGDFKLKTEAEGTTMRAVLLAMTDLYVRGKIRLNVKAHDMRHLRGTRTDLQAQKDREL